MRHARAIGLITATAATATLMGAASSSRADTWVSAELPAALAVSTPQDEIFGAGAMPALGLYQDLLPYLALGLRLRGGVLANGSEPEAGVMDPGVGGIGLGGAALRVHGKRPWFEAVLGGALTGEDKVPAAELGVGWSWDVGPVSLGPSLRVLHLFRDAEGVNPGSADVAMIGLELTAGRKKPRRPLAWVAAADLDRVVDQDVRCPLAGGEGCPAPITDRDNDGIPDTEDACVDEPETVNGVDDRDGCPDEGLFVVENDRIVLEERVLFELNRARIRRGGKHVIAAIAEAWRQHTEWEHMVIEGHADIRGPDPFNRWLSETRAGRVREALIENGLPTNAIDSIGYGASRPREPGTSEEAHQRNRRVEFVIVRGPGRMPKPAADAAPAPEATSAPAPDATAPAAPTSGDRP